MKNLTSQSEYRQQWFAFKQQELEELCMDIEYEIQS
jgi:hypothetical protein